MRSRSAPGHLFNWLYLFALPMLAVAPAHADETLWSTLRSGGYVLLIRHAATEPGIGDPPQFKAGDCKTQRNLSAAGREQAAKTGQRLKDAGITISAVRSSRWCRCLDTASIAFGSATPDPTLDSFFGDRSAQNEQQTAAVRARIQSFRGPGNLVLVTHQVNITALTGEFPAEGEIFVVRASAEGSLQLKGRITPVKP
ncbi:MAG: hypothetical protein RLZZ445_2046 [Pseudomonadota bacterium]|jgi:phosphohistidine phosphatase SixA